MRHMIGLLTAKYENMGLETYGRDAEEVEGIGNGW